MREILFRGKRKNNGEWIEGRGVDRNFIESYILTEEYDSSTGFYIGEYEVITETVGQYTGLTDKNGKKIFEGDIVKCCHRWTNHNFGSTDEETFYSQKIKNAYGKHKEVTNGLYDHYYYYRNYCIEYFAINGRFRIRNGGQFHDLKYSFILNHDIEVIGNIHDNPELLRGE